MLTAAWVPMSCSAVRCSIAVLTSPKVSPATAWGPILGKLIVPSGVTSSSTS